MMKQWIRQLLKRVILWLAEGIDLYAFLRAHSPSEQAKATHNERLMARLAHCGQGVHFNGRIDLAGPEFVSIGNNVHIGDGAFIKAAGGLVIGDHVHISRNLTLYTINHQYEGLRLPYDETLTYKPVTIERNVWIGMNVCITPGVTIGEGAIIGMGTVVSKDVPPYAVVGSQPYRVLKQRDVAHYQTRQEEAAYGGVNGRAISQEVQAGFHVSGREKGANLFFVVSTGRAGSTSIARILSQHPDITCRHEPNRQLIRLSTEYAHGDKREDAVRKELRAMYVENHWFPQKGAYGESDQKLGNLITLLHELLPEARFIWLTRSAADFVASGTGRGWFADDEETLYEALDRKEEMRQWVVNRLSGEKTGNMTAAVWKSLSVFERNAWYWSYWNGLIETQLHQIPSSQWMHLRLEALVEQLSAVNQFLGKTVFEYDVVKTNQATYAKALPVEWSESQKEQYKKWCGAGMSKWYPTHASLAQSIS